MTVELEVRCSGSSIPDRTLDVADREWREVIVEIQDTCESRGCEPHVDITLDGNMDAFRVLAREPDKFEEVVSLSRQLVQYGVAVRWLIPAIPPLVFRLEGIVSLARAELVEPLLVLPEILENTSACATDLSPDEKLFLWDLITYRFLESDLQMLNSRQRNYYRLLADFFGGRAGDREPEIEEMRSLALATNNSSDDRDGPVTSVIGSAREAGEVLLDGVRGLLLYLTVALFGTRKRDLQDADVYKKVLLIGAYGGEHIGDEAILGGVLYRIHKRFGTREAVLMTQRVAHTRHLQPMLDVPVEFTVDEYERAQIRKHVTESDCVVFAGGPLIDLPKQLVRHLYTVSLARKQGKPFIAEGIGPGPFVRFPSKFTARRLMTMASRISLRSADAVDHEVVRGLDFEVGRCPAFDYLQTRGEELSRLPVIDNDSIENLLAGTDGRPVIGINIRPIGHMYTVGAPDTDVAAYTRRIEDRFEQRFADGIRQYTEQSDVRPCFVFFPMNAIQFGLSDLLSAYRIQSHLGPDVDFRVWQADASLDGVVALLRKIDVAITMRFHATIFAMSQDCKVIGIDYRIGKKDKIAGLMEDVGEERFCDRIDLLTGEWLADRLKELTGS